MGLGHATSEFRDDGSELIGFRLLPYFSQPRIIDGDVQPYKGKGGLRPAVLVRPLLASVLFRPLLHRTTFNVNGVHGQYVL